MPNQPNQPGQQPPIEEAETQAAAREAISAIEFLTKILGLGYLIALLLGAILMSFYFARYSFNPGISASDAVALSLFTFSFLFTVLIFMIFGGVSCYPLLYLITTARRLLSELRSRRDLRESIDVPLVEWKPGYVPILVAGLIFDALMVAMLSFAPWRPVNVLLIVMFFGFGIFPCIAMFGTPRPRLRTALQPAAHPIDRWYQAASPRKQQMFANTVIAAALIFVTFSVLQDRSMSLFGYRIENVDVRMKKEDFEFVSNRALMERRTVNSCDRIISGEYLLRGVDVLWHKVGAQALLRYPALSIGETEKDENIRLELPNSDFRLVHAAPKRRCIELQYAEVVEYDTSAAELAVQLKEKFAALGPLPDKHRVIATIYTPAGDARPAALAAHREVVRNVVALALGLTVDHVLVEHAAKYLPKWNCETVGAEVKEHCNEANSRIEIAFVVSH